MSGDAGETLTGEARERPRAGGAAIGAGVATLLGALLLAVVIRGGPQGETVGVLEALDAQLAGRPVDSALVRNVAYFGDRVVLLVLSAVLLALGVVLTAYALAFLFRAARARNPALGRAGIIAAVVAGVAYPIGHLVSALSRWIGAAGFDPESGTAQQARDAVTSPTAAVAPLFEQLGLFALAVAIVLIALNAMRVGLLTRFLGILGIAAGGLAIINVFPIGEFVRGFWLVSVGFLILGRGRTGLLPAWRTGRAEPWPSQQELREARGGAAPAPATAAPARRAPAAGGSTSGQRRKRKRRR